MDEYAEADDDSPAKFDTALRDYFVQHEAGEIPTRWLIHVQLLNGEGQEEMWTLSSPGLGITDKMGMSAFMFEHFRGMVEHRRPE